MLTLALNTGFAAIEAVIVRDGEVLADTLQAMPRGQDAHTPGVVGALLAEAGIEMAEIDRLTVVTGPGSFTGLRVGISYMRGLALVLEAPCIGVTSLEASVPLGFDQMALAALQAKKRPPDQTWWTQGIGPDGAGLAEVNEAGRAALSDMLVGFKAPLFIDEARGLGLSDKLDVRPLRPSALTAALKAEVFEPAAHLPRPVYARDPDAALPQPKT